MDEKKKVGILIGIIVLTFMMIIFGSLFESSKSDKYLKEFNDAFSGSENKLVMIGRDNCSWCKLFKPTLDSFAEEYGLEYIYINTNEITNSALKKLLKKIGVSYDEFGTPLTLIVKDNSVVDSISGFADESEVFEFVKKYDLIPSDSKLKISYVDYDGYKKIVKSEGTSILVIGQTTCSHCIATKPVLKQIISDKNIKINFIEINMLETEQRKKVDTFLEPIKDSEGSYGTPTTLIIKNGVIVDSAAGALDYDSYVELFKKNGLIK